MITMQATNRPEAEIQRALAASDMYQLLSRSLHLPTEEIAMGLLDGSLAEDVLTILAELNLSAAEIGKIRTKFRAAISEGITQEELHAEMRREYTRLFTHPQKPAVDIYESAFRYTLEGGKEKKPALFISPAALDAERCYKKAGLVMAKEVNEPGDHMATEMEFMMFLCLQKAKALQENNQEELAKREGEIQEFQRIHLQKWAKDFFNRCTSSSRSEVYRTLGEIGSIFMTEMLAHQLK